MEKYKVVSYVYICECNSLFFIFKTVEMIHKSLISIASFVFVSGKGILNWCVFTLCYAVLT